METGEQAILDYCARRRYAVQRLDEIGSRVFSMDQPLVKAVVHLHQDVDTDHHRHHIRVCPYWSVCSLYCAVEYEGRLRRPTPSRRLDRARRSRLVSLRP